MKTTVCSVCGCAVDSYPSKKGMCTKCYFKEYYETNKEHRKIVGRKYRTENRAKVRACNLTATKKWYHGKGKDVNRARRLSVFFQLTPDDFEQIKQYQASDSRFRLLLNKPNYTKREAVEHRHRDGLIRGVMNAMLNRTYGIIERLYPENTAEVLRALADFHENPPATAALGEEVYGVIGKAQHKRKLLYGPHGSSDPQPRRNARRMEV